MGSRGAHRGQSNWKQLAFSSRKAQQISKAEPKVWKSPNSDLTGFGQANLNGGKSEFVDTPKGSWIKGLLGYPRVERI